MGDEALCPMHRSLPMTQAARLDETGNLSSKSCGLGLGLGSTWRGFESGFEAEWGEQRSCLLRLWVRVRGGACSLCPFGSKRVQPQASRGNF